LLTYPKSLFEWIRIDSHENKCLDKTKVGGTTLTVKEVRHNVGEKFEHDTQYERNKAIGRKLFDYFDDKYKPYSDYENE